MTWEDDDPEDWPPPPPDPCPTCGDSMAEHSPEQDRRCTDAFYCTELLIQGAIARHTKGPS